MSSNVPATAKKPQDRQRKAAVKSTADAIAERTFTMEYDGETYESKPVGDVLTPGFMRRVRRLPELDQLFEIVEGLYDEDVLSKTVDKMDRKEFAALMESMGEFMNDFLEVSLGESPAS